MPESNSATFGSLLRHARSFIGRFWQFLSGVVFTIVAFSTTFTDWKRPDISVEITEVSNSISEKIDLELRADLADVAKTLQTSGGLRRLVPAGISYSDMERSLRVLEKTLDEQEKQLDEAQRKYFEITQQQVTSETKLEKLSALEYDDEIPTVLRRRVFGSTPSESIDKAIDGIRDSLLKAREKLGDRRRQFDRAKAQLKAFKEAAFSTEAKLFVTAAVGNKGAGATSLRQQALLRADLGEGNYLDITLRMVDYSQNSELGPQAFRVVRFYSDELKSMPTLDQERFRNLFNNISPTNMYLTDVRGGVYRSNTIPFSQGVYEQKVYDSLKAKASAKWCAPLPFC